MEHMMTDASVVGSLTFDGGDVISSTRTSIVTTPVGDNKTTA
jgi:hypothetical protein